MIDPESPPSPVPSVKYWGAAQTVSGSMHLLEIAGRTILLDCGLYQGRRGEAARRNSQFPFRASDISAVVVTHAHIDHCGNLPGLVRQGYRGPIYTTPMTADLCAVMLADAARVQEEDTAHQIISRRYAEPWNQPLYTGPDAARATGLFQRHDYNSPFELIPGVTATLHDAGHLPGSAMVHVETDAGSLTFTGDLGRTNDDVLPPAAAIPPADVILTESTYGGRRHPDMNVTLGKLATAVTRSASTGGKLLVPAFGLGRTQLLVHYLLDVMAKGRAPRLPIFVDSPLAANVADVYRRHPEAFRVDLPADQDAVRYVQSFDESMALCDRAGPCVIVAAGGMCDNGRIVEHIARNVADENAGIVLVSYQAPRTLGRQLLDRTPSVHFRSKEWKVRAEVTHLEGFSGHADHDDLMNHLKPLAGGRSRIRLIHGEIDAAEALANDLRDHGFTDVTIPAPGDSEPLRV